MIRSIFIGVFISLLAACGSAPLPTATPTPPPTETATPVPTNTATFTPSPTWTIAPPTQIIETATPTLIPLDPLLDVPIPPPIEIRLPEGWQFGFNTLAYTDIDGSPDTVPFALFTGPVSDGVGTIVLVWGFDSVTTGLQFSEEFGQRNIWLDSLRILRTVLFDSRCNIGTAPQRDYSVGGLAATGNTINVTDCPDGQPDTRGWIAALVEEEINFAFYVYIDPIPPAGHPSEQELQGILDSVVFLVDDIRVSQDAFIATQQAIQLTQTPATD